MGARAAARGVGHSVAALCSILLLVACAPTPVAAADSAPQAGPAAPTPEPELLPEVARERELPPPPATGSRPDARPPSVSLDRLFELPAGFETKPRERRAGGDEQTWRRRFLEARDALERASVDLKRSKSELATLAEESNAWTLAAPIGGATAAAADAPLSYELRQRIKRQQVAVDEAKQDLLHLEVEANLASVPEAWRAAGSGD